MAWSAGHDARNDSCRLEAGPTLAGSANHGQDRGGVRLLMSNQKLVLSHTAALDAALKHEPIEDEQKVADETPHSTVTTGFDELGALNGNQVGIWAMSVGEMTDVETDECFVVLSGRGKIGRAHV